MMNDSIMVKKSSKVKFASHAQVSTYKKNTDDVIGTISKFIRWTKLSTPTTQRGSKIVGPELTPAELRKIKNGVFTLQQIKQHRKAGLTVEKKGRFTVSTAR